jgi:hypothetical protein
MKKTTVIFAMFLIALTAQIGFAQDKKAEDKELLIKASKFLEEKPFDKNAKDIRGWAVNYIILTDQVSILICGGELLTPVLDKKNKNSTELVGQYTIGMAAFKLANPSKKDDENAAQLAGVESMLKAYEAMIAEKPKTKFDGMDALITKRDKGEIKGIIDAANCGKKETK